MYLTIRKAVIAHTVFDGSTLRMPWITVHRQYVDPSLPLKEVCWPISIYTQYLSGPWKHYIVGWHHCSDGHKGNTPKTTLTSSLYSSTCFLILEVSVHVTKSSIFLRNAEFNVMLTHCRQTLGHVVQIAGIAISKCVSCVNTTRFCHHGLVW